MFISRTVLFFLLQFTILVTELSAYIGTLLIKLSSFKVFLMDEVPYDFRYYLVYRIVIF